MITHDMLFGEIRKEMARAVDLHGPLPTNHEAALRIMMEEVGEACEAIHDLLHGKSREEVRAARAHLVEELIQVNATAFRWLANAVEEESNS